MAAPSRTLEIQHTLRAALLAECADDDPADVVTALGCELAEWLAHTTDDTTIDRLIVALRVYVTRLRELAPPPS